jgi:hypothetical protein
MTPRLEDPMLERPFDPNPCERFGLQAIAVAPELERALEDEKVHAELLEMLADFASGGDAEALREWTRTTIQNMRERRAIDEHEARRTG